MLLADPTELRDASRLPQELREKAHARPGLEGLTGADLLVSPLSIPASSDHLLKRHAQAGVLIQRKTGNDLPASVTDGRLTRSLLKMSEWSDRPWLVVVGHIVKHPEKSVALVDGRESLQYNALVSALDWWQLRGGYITTLSNDQALVGWVGKWLDRLRVLQEQPERAISRAAQQQLASEGKDSVLTALPGIGRERARALMQYAQEQPARALAVLTNDDPAYNVQGVGRKTKQRIKKYLGLDENELIMVASRDMLTNVAAFLLDVDGGDFINGATLYAELMQWLGVECSMYKERGGWQRWLTETIEQQETARQEREKKQNGQ